jgi:hypothetical protein
MPVADGRFDVIIPHLSGEIYGRDVKNMQLFLQIMRLMVAKWQTL